MFFFKKKIKAPVSLDQQNLEAVKLWYVRWVRRYDQYSCNSTEPCIEAFLNQGDAEHFAESLRAAFKLLRFTGSEAEVAVDAKETTNGLR